MIEGDGRLGDVETDREVAYVCHDVCGSWEAGRVGHAHYLALDSRTKHSTQNLHRHPWLDDRYRR